MVVSGFRSIGSAPGREGEVGSCSDHSDLLLPGLTSTWNDVLCARAADIMLRVGRLSLGRLDLLGPTRNYSDLLEPSKMACRNGYRGVLPALLSDYGARWANHHPYLLGTTRTYSYPLGPAGPGISPGLRGRLISLNGSGGRSSTGTGPWGRSRAMRGCLCRRGPSGSTWRTWRSFRGARTAV